MTAERVLARCCQMYRETSDSYVHNRTSFDSLAMFDAVLLVWLHGTPIESIDVWNYGLR